MLLRTLEHAGIDVKFPGYAQNVPDLEEGVPALEESVPVLEESVPVLEESVPVLEESVPTYNTDTLSDTKKTPAANRHRRRGRRCRECMLMLFFFRMIFGRNWTC